VALGAGNALAFLATHWSTAFLAWETYKSINSIQEVDSIRVVPKEHKGKGDIVRINKKDVHSQIFLVT
jgi:cation-transporting ATPase 13A1